MRHSTWIECRICHSGRVPSSQARSLWHNGTMLTHFFLALRAGGLKPGVGEYLTLLGAVKAGLAEISLERFHTLARLTLVKDESQFDRFDRIFGAYFDGVSAAFEHPAKIPDEWLQQQMQRLLTDEEKDALKSLGSFDELMKQLSERLREQKGRHEGGNRWIGTGGTSPFGHGGFNPEGIRIGGKGGGRRAVKVWEQRDFRNLDDQLELGTRNIKIALRKLRRFARNAEREEFDLDATITGTARNAGWLDLKYRRERHNAIKLMVLFDIGGSMDEHIRLCEELFSAARAEFKHLEHFYFHNFLYERLWKDNNRRYGETTSTFDLMHKFPHDWRVVIIGDASMAPYEISEPGGSIEHWNEESGAVWMERIATTWPKLAWLNPVPEHTWDWTPSIQMTKSLIADRMFPLTLAGLDQAIAALRR
jgi:uncharacterized protein